MRTVFGKTRKRFWTACRRLRMRGLSGVIPELIKRAKPQSVCVEPGRSSISSRRIRIGPSVHRADNRRWTFVPAANPGGNRRARIAAISAFDNRKEGRAPAIRVEGPGPLQDLIGVLRKTSRLGQKLTVTSGPRDVS